MPTISSPSLRRVATVDIKATDPRSVSDMFRSRIYAENGRDPDLDSLPDKSYMHASQEGKYAAWRYHRPATTEKIAELILGTCSANRRFLAARLKDRGDVLSLAQVEDLVERTSRGERTGIPRNGQSAMFFVLTGCLRNDGLALAVVSMNRKKLWRISLSTCCLASPVLRTGNFFMRFEWLK